MRVLMCPPLHYEPGPGEDASAAMSEWRGLYRLLRDELDVQVDLLEPRPDMPRLVLAASGGFVWKDSFIAGRPRDASRRSEGEAWTNFFMVRGYAIPELPEACCFDGERDLVMAAGTPFAGYRSDDDLTAHKVLSGILDHEVHSLRLSDEWKWPLDTCLCPLGNDVALWHPEAFSPDALKVLEDKLPGLQPVNIGEARRLGCSALWTEGSVIMPEGCESTAATLQQDGFQVRTLPLGSFALRGAGPRALALKIED